MSTTNGIHWRATFAATSLLLAALGAGNSHAQLTIYPANPAVGSTIRIDGVSGCFGAPVEVSVEGFPYAPGGARIKVFDPIWLDPPLMPCPPGNKNHVVYGPVSAGTYRLEHYLRLSPPTPDQLLGTSTFTVTGGNNTNVPIAWFGNWWAPGQSGWAINLDRDPATGNIFMAWYTHEQQDGVIRPVWIVAPNMTQSQGFGMSMKLTGEAYRAQGNRGLFFPPGGSPVPPPFTITAQSVGTITLDFTAINRMTLNYALAVGSGFVAPGSITMNGTALLQKFTY